MNYQESLTYLGGAAHFGIRPGLERIRALLEKLDHPENAYRIIHVTGTNGKGSVTAMAASVLQAAGLSVGRYTSPHLISYTERISVDGTDIPEEDFALAADAVRKAAARIQEDGMEAPTEFELLTAMGFWYFRHKKVDYAVVEVGMGGLLDSTNVVMPVVSVITNVAMDHMKYCGSTLEEIAHHKAGIIKKGIPVVTAAQREGLKEIQKEAHHRESRLYFYGRDFSIDSRTRSASGQIVTLKRKDMPKELEKGMLYVPFFGAYQAVNAAVAAMAMTLVMKQDDRIGEDALREGIARTQWPGRFEVHEDRVPVILDGAHNPAGAEALSETLAEQYPDRRKRIVFASLQDKDTDTVLSFLVHPGDMVLAVPAPTPRSRTPEEILEKVTGDKKAEPDVAQALLDAVEGAAPEDIVVVCGSLYILGDAMKWLNHRKN